MTDMNQPSFGNVDTSTVDNLIAGDFPIVVRQVAVVPKAELKRGMLVGRVKESGKVKQTVASAQDGSEIPVYIVAADSTKETALVYVTGQFNKNALILDKSITIDDDMIFELESRSIYLENSIKGS